MDFNIWILTMIFFNLRRFIAALEMTECYDWNNMPTLSLDCGTDHLIHIQSVGTWRQPESEASDQFCASPARNTVTDCSTQDSVNERSMFQHCNFHQECSRLMAFEDNPDCMQSGYGGQRYFHIQYECIDMIRNGNPVLFEDMVNTQESDTFSSTSMLHLSTQGYPSYIATAKTVCHVTLGAYSELRINTYDIRSYRADACAYKLYMNDNQTQYTQCANEVWNTGDSDEIRFRNSESGNKTVQIAFARENTARQGAQGKLWLQLQSFSTVSVNEENQGILLLYCDVTMPIWPRPANQPTTTTSTTTTTTTTSNVAPNNNVSRQDPTSTFSTPVSPDNVVEPKPNDKKDDDESSLLPVIGGVVAGGVVVLIIIIIVIVLLVKRYQSNHTPPKSIDVIDAWDDVSTLSRPEKTVSHLSNGSSHYNNGIASYYEPSSPATTDSNISPYDDSGHFESHDAFHGSGELYSEIPEPPGVRASQHNNHHGYIFEDDLYSGTVPKRNGQKVFMNGGSSVFSGNSLDRKRVSELYSKPMKPKRKQHTSNSLPRGGFDNPTLGGGDIYERAHQFELKADDDIYGYSTSLA